MINPSDCWRILVGEIVKYWEDGKEQEGVITKLSGHPSSPSIHIATLSGDGIYSRYSRYDDYSEFKKMCPSREGYILGNASLIRSQEDWLCHDSRCMPGKIGGCEGCEYQGRTRTRKIIFYLGDEVYDPIWKSYHKVISILLAIDTGKIENLPPSCLGLSWEKEIIPSFSYGKHLEQFIELIKMSREIGLRLKSNCFSLRYVLSGNTRKTLYQGSELRVWKRHSYYLDQDQLKDICQMCLFGEGSEKCQTCKTMTYKLVR